MNQAITGFLRDEIGLDPALIGDRALALAVRSRVEALGLSGAAGYLSRFSISKAERQALVEELVVPESWFFREPAAFSLLSAHALSCRDRGKSGYRVACLACASGEEPYSAAITLLESGLVDFHVDGLDISTTALSRAQRAIYGPRAERETAVPSPYRIELGAGRFELTQNLRERVSFHTGNVSDPALPAADGGYHAVFCRNVFIYLTPRARQRCLTSLSRLLSEGGILFLGSAEDPRSLSADWQPAGPGEAFAYSRASASPSSGRRQAWAEATELGMEPIREARLHSSRHQPRESRVSGTPLIPGSGVGEASPSVSSGLPAVRATGGPDGGSGGGIEEIRSLADRGLLERALAACDDRLSREGPEALVYFLRALVLGGMGDPEGAEADFLRTLCLDEAHEGALTHLALLAERRGDRARAAGFRRRARALGRGAA